SSSLLEFSFGNGRSTPSISRNITFSVFVVMV
ncbi:MAG: hypothetical protein ACI90V_013016, partial [Bacillariaceae sp.]